MLRSAVVIRILVVTGLASAIAAACGSSDKQQTVRDESGGAGGESNGGGPSSAGSANLAAGETSAGAQGPNGGADSVGGAGEGGAMAGGESGAGSPGGGSPSGGAPAGEGGMGGAPVDFGDPTSVASFGCFIRSGDGGDLLPDGGIAVNVTNPVYSAACDSGWVSSNQNAYAPEQTPTTLIMRRAFVIDPNLGTGDFTITYKADDAVDFVLNGELIIGCTPPAGNAGFCQQVCSTSAIAAGSLKPPGEVNLLEARLINTQSVPAGDGNFGYTALNYSVCVSPAQ